MTMPLDFDRRISEKRETQSGGYGNMSVCGNYASIFGHVPLVPEIESACAAAYRIGIGSRKTPATLSSKNLKIAKDWDICEL